MGLTSSSTGTKLLDNDIEALKSKCDFTIAIAGNPNVGKSTVFNSLTGLHQHTGNWPGKTVSNASGIANFNDKDFLLVDIPGTYSIMSPGWQLRNEHILQRISVVTLSPLPSLASVTEETTFNNSVRFIPLLSSNIKSL